VLGALESRLTAKVADALNGRGATIVSAPLPINAPDAGQRSIRVSIDAVVAAPNFEAERTMFSGDAPALRGRRVVHLSFTARVRATAQPSALQAQPVSEARRLVLEDLSLVLHALDGTTFRAGTDLDAAGDPGYDVLAFGLVGGSARPDLQDGAVVGELEYRGTVRVWPPGVSDAATPIRAVETVVETLPVEIRAAQAVVRAGEQTVVRVKVLSRTRGTGAARVPMRLAVTVLGDVPPADRGTVLAGAPSTLPGFSVFDVDRGMAAITYAAPAPGFTRARTEHVAVHVATPEGNPGLLLGSAAIRLMPVVP